MTISTFPLWRFIPYPSAESLQTGAQLQGEVYRDNEKQEEIASLRRRLNQISQTVKSLRAKVPALLVSEELGDIEQGNASGTEQTIRELEREAVELKQTIETKQAAYVIWRKRESEKKERERWEASQQRKRAASGEPAREVVEAWNRFVATLNAYLPRYKHWAQSEPKGYGELSIPALLLHFDKLGLYNDPPASNGATDAANTNDGQHSNGTEVMK